MKTEGLHHVTAITGNIQGNLDFYVGLLGLRLVKRTVIQEEPSTYHLFYGDGVGSTGTDITFFDWPQVGRDRPGPRNVVRTDFATVDEAAVAWWRQRLTAAGVTYSSQHDFAGRASLHFSDPERQRLGIVAAGSFPAYHHWPVNVATPATALQALHSVTLGVDQLEPTVKFLSELFGYEEVTTFRSLQENEGDAVILSMGAGNDEAGKDRAQNRGERHVGKEMVVVERREKQQGLRGIGSVHHVALTIGPDTPIEAWHERLLATGLKVTEIMRRFYFDSLYVRIPGGTLFELATTTGAGLTADEPLSSLGEELTLPPFLEERRAEIAASLEPFMVPTPRRDPKQESLGKNH